MTNVLLQLRRGDGLSIPSPTTRIENSGTDPASPTKPSVFGMKAERMIDDLEKLYDFGVCLDLLKEDRGFSDQLKKVKERFRSLR